MDQTQFFLNMKKKKNFLRELTQFEKPLHFKRRKEKLRGTPKTSCQKQNYQQINFLIMLRLMMKIKI